MSLRNCVVFFAIAVICGVALLKTANPALAFKCEKQIMVALAKVSMGKRDMASVKVAKYPNPVGGGAQSSNYRYDAWIRSNNCSGYVMVHMNRGCVVQQMYTTGDCKIADMPQ